MKKILLITLLSISLFSCKENTIRTTKKIESEKDYREVIYDTLFEYSTEIEYRLQTKDYILSYHISENIKDTWFSDLEFNVPLGKDYRLTIDGKELYYEKYSDGSGSGFKDAINAITGKEPVSDSKYTKAYMKYIGGSFDAYIIDEMKNAKKVTLQVVGEKPRELNIQKDATEFITAYNKSLTTKVDWKQLEKNKYKQ